MLVVRMLEQVLVDVHESEAFDGPETVLPKAPDPSPHPRRVIQRKTTRNRFSPPCHSLQIISGVLCAVLGWSDH